MANSNAIQIQFSQALKQVEELEVAAKSLKKLSGEKMEMIINGASGSWSGENAKQYLNKLIQLEDKIGLTAEDLNDTAGTIRAIARRVYDAEMAAAAIANTRVYEQTQSVPEGRG